MVKPDISIVPLATRGRDLDEVALVAARAFHYDPFFAFLEPAEVRRARGLALFCRSAVGSHGTAGQVTGARLANGRLVGVAAWVPPGAYPLGVGGQVRGFLGAGRALVLRPRGLRDGVRYMNAIERAHPKDPMWYLLLLVVDPSAQRTGIGAHLQEPVLERAEQDGIDCYLETQTEDNLPYYRRFGYEVEAELRPVPAGPPLWTMRRRR
jgi:GNAT superfamily N-acetyltransferase